MALLDEIAAAFPDRGAPRPDAVVRYDGLDQLAKEYAARAFGGKTREQIAAIVGKGPTGIEGLWGIEDLEVLEAPALQYYLEPFLRYLVAHQLDKPEDFSFSLAYHLSEVLRRGGADMLTPEQRRVVADIADRLSVRVSGSDEWAAAHRGHYERLKQLLRS